MTKTTSDSDQDHQEQSEQPSSEGKDQAQEGQSKTYEVNGMNMTADELVDAYRELQKHSTKTEQRASELEKSLKGSEDGGQQYEADDIEQVVNVLLPHLEGKFAKRDDVLSKDEVKLQSILDRNPDLRSKEQEIKDLASLPSNKGKAYEDIISQYGFSSKDKLSKARQSDPVGNRVDGAESSKDKERIKAAVKKAVSGESTWVRQ